MSLDLVRQVKELLAANGTDLSGPCGAFQIVKRVAWLKGHGAGLLHKRPEQNGCSVEGERYAVDIVMYPDGRAYDILIDAGGENGPLWSEIEPIEPSLYRPAIDPGDVPAPDPDPEPDPDPVPPTNDLELVLKALAAHHDEMLAQLQECKARIALTASLLADHIVEVKVRQDRSYVGSTKMWGGPVELKPKP